MPWFFGLIALLAGVALAVQVGVNNGLKAKLGQPIAASGFSFATGTLALALYWLATRAPLPAPDKLRGGPWWAWLGGSLGAVYIVLTVTYSPKLGAAGWLGLVVAGQIVTSVVLDHFGLVGFAQHSISWPRVIGVALLLGGAALVLRS
jgi:bacterial/archaeal transporter family-2 protein